MPCGAVSRAKRLANRPSVRWLCVSASGKPRLNETRHFVAPSGAAVRHGGTGLSSD